MQVETFVGSLESGTTCPTPTIEAWLPAGGGRRPGLVIFPGGGYGHLAEHEGKGYAEHFAAAGIACFVVRYRLAPEARHPAMLEDALAAVGTVRGRADELNVRPDAIGVMGSSAGGHLAAHCLVGWPEYDARVSLRPDFGVLCYPVITSTGPQAHVGSMDNLLGKTPTAALLQAVSPEKQVREETPPCFLWHGGDDAAVPADNSMLFAQALRQHGVPFELHIYGEGVHGLGLRTPYDWAGECVRWIGQTVG